MLPAAVAISMAGFIGAFGGSTPAAHAIDGDICQVDVEYDHILDDGQGNSVYAVARGVTYGLVFRVEDSENEHENVAIRIDSETGSARITSQAEWLDDGDEEANIGHVLVQPATGSLVVDTMDPDEIDDSDGNWVGSINGWLQDVGYSAFVDDDSDSVCGNDSDGEVNEPGEGGDASAEGEDNWGFIDFECIEAGFFHIDISSPDDTEEIGATLKFYCGGQPDSATIAASRTTVETDPTEVDASSYGQSTITVTVEDQFGDRIEHAEVTFSTDNCTLKNTDPVGDNAVSPAGGGTTVTTYTDTDTSSDTNFIANNPLEFSAGTAEVLLDCTTSAGKAGVANITAIVQRPGSDIVLKTTVTVVGPTSATGLTLTLTPDDVECGETILATATAVDSLGQPVSAGTSIYFTTDTSSGVVGGYEGAQGYAASDEGEASVLIATDPGNPGIHTVIAYTMDSDGRVLAQVSETYTCDGAVAPVAPTVNPPTTGTGTGSITPPNTGDAGLAAGSTSSSLFVIAGAVAFVLAGLASVRFARN
jgi:hypothetical protein